MNRKTFDELKRLLGVLQEQLDATEPIFSTDEQEAFYYSARTAIPELIEGIERLVNAINKASQWNSPEIRVQMLEVYLGDTPAFIKEMLG